MYKKQCKNNKTHSSSLDLIINKTTQGPCIGVVYDIAIHQTMFIKKHSFNFIQ